MHKHDKQVILLSVYHGCLVTAHNVSSQGFLKVSHPTRNPFNWWHTTDIQSICSHLLLTTLL